MTESRLRSLLGRLPKASVSSQNWTNEGLPLYCCRGKGVPFIEELDDSLSYEKASEEDSAEPFTPEELLKK